MTKIFGNGEFMLPEWEKCLTSSFYIPYLTYLLFFFINGSFIRKYFWQKYTGFKKYRLENLSMSLFHATVTGLFALIFTFLHPYEMFFEIIHWYQNWANHVLFFSLAYFTYDLINITMNEQNKYTVELFIHHTTSIFVFSCSIFSGKFQLYAFWALLMEVSSIFLHIRTISMISGYAKDNCENHRIIQIINVITCLIFRFGVQVWQISFILINKNLVHPFYFNVGFYGGLFFIIFNTILIFRLLASDGFLCEKVRIFVSIDRDNAQTEYKKE
uniref:TLC domain-containing protein n=1 Tax=Strongyloides papillosus TaxID=174720 RepID=A0A0N5C645_STREA